MRRISRFLGVLAVLVLICGAMPAQAANKLGGGDPDVHAEQERPHSDRVTVTGGLVYDLAVREKYQTALELYFSGSYAEALVLFEELGSYAGSDKIAAELRNYVSRDADGQTAGRRPAFADPAGASGESENLLALLAAGEGGPWDQVWAQLYSCAKSGNTSLSIPYPEELDLSADRNELRNLVYSVGVSEFRWAFRDSLVELTDIKYYNNFEICTSVAAAIAYLDECAAEKRDEFRIFFSPQLAEILFGNDRLELESMLSVTGLKNPSDYRYSEDYGMIRFSSASYYDTPGRKSGFAFTLEDCTDLLSSHFDAADDAFEILIPEDLMDLLLGSSLISDDFMLLSEIKTNCGVISFNYYTSGRFLGIRKIEYYTGQKLLRACNTGNEDSLTPREKQTLQAALDIVGSLSGTELEREKQIHDILCDRIVYYTDETPHDDNDCAIGALLDGRADCDGYSDAFFLCGSLAGLEIRYQHGNSLVLPSSDDENDVNPVEQNGSHMWNLIRVNGSWVAIDVTWDDNETGHSYVYYNLGEDQVAVTHEWDERAVACPLVPVTGNEYRNSDIAQIRVESWQEIYDLMKSCALSGKTRVCFTYPASLNVSENHERLNTEIRSVGVDDYYWDISDESAEVYQITYQDCYAICGSEQEAIDFINRCGQRSVSGFWVYFSPSLSEKLFADERYGLLGMLFKTRLKDPCTFSYNDECRRVCFTDASFWPSDNGLYFSSVRTLDDVWNRARACSEAKALRMVFDYRGGVDLQQYKDRLSSALYSVGVDSFYWSFNSEYAMIYDIVYYDNYRICSTKSEIASYLKECRSKRISTIRIFCASDDLYEQLHYDSSKQFFRLLSDAGCKNTSISYNDTSRMFLVDGAKW